MTALAPTWALLEPALTETAPAEEALLSPLLITTAPVLPTAEPLPISTAPLVPAKVPMDALEEPAMLISPSAPVAEM
jgi:hypothetical protein